jgi:hypothetical protein
VPKRTLEPIRKVTYGHAVAYARNLNKRGREYLHGRNISDEIIEKYHLGMNTRGTSITVPLLLKNRKGKNTCPGPEHIQEGYSPYVSIPRSVNKGIFNFDLLDFGKEHQIFGVIANSIFDVMTLDGMGFPVIGPFASENTWEHKWGQYINWDYILNLGDRDEPNNRGQHPGVQYMLRRALLLDGSSAGVVINTLPPAPYKDFNHMSTGAGVKAVWDFLNDTLDRGKSLEEITETLSP